MTKDGPNSTPAPTLLVPKEPDNNLCVVYGSLSVIFINPGTVDLQLKLLQSSIRGLPQYINLPAQGRRLLVSAYGTAWKWSQPHAQTNPTLKFATRAEFFRHIRGLRGGFQSFTVAYRVLVGSGAKAQDIGITLTITAVHHFNDKDKPGIEVRGFSGKNRDNNWVLGDDGERSLIWSKNGGAGRSIFSTDTRIAVTPVDAQKSVTPDNDTYRKFIESGQGIKLQDKGSPTPFSLVTTPSTDPVTWAIELNPNAKVLVPVAPNQKNPIKQRLPEVEFLGPWNREKSDWPLLTSVEPALYDAALKGPVRYPSTVTPDARLTMGSDQDDDDFVNRDSNRFWIRVTDVKGLGTVEVDLDTYDRTGNLTSFAGPNAYHCSSKIALWEAKDAGEGRAYYYSPWLILTTTRWDVDPGYLTKSTPARPCAFTSSGFPKSLSRSGEIKPGEPGFRIRRGVPLGTIVARYQKSPASVTVCDPSKLKVARLRIVVLRASASEDDTKAAAEYGGKFISEELQKTRDIFARIGILLVTDGECPKSQLRIQKPYREMGTLDYVHICDTPLNGDVPMSITPTAETPTYADWLASQRHHSRTWDAHVPLPSPRRSQPDTHTYMIWSDQDALDKSFPADGESVIRIFLVGGLWGTDGAIYNGMWVPANRILVTHLGHAYQQLPSGGWRYTPGGGMSALAHEIGHALTDTHSNNETRGHYQQPPFPRNWSGFFHYEFQHLMKHAPKCIDGIAMKDDPTKIYPAGCTKPECEDKTPPRTHTWNQDMMDQASSWSMDLIWDEPDGRKENGLKGYNWYREMRNSQYVKPLTESALGWELGLMPSYLRSLGRGWYWR